MQGKPTCRAEVEPILKGDDTQQQGKLEAKPSCQGKTPSLLTFHTLPRVPFSLSLHVHHAWSEKIKRNKREAGKKSSLHVYETEQKRVGSQTLQPLSLSLSF